MYEPETLNAYELGMKSNLSGGTMMLNLAAFYYDYEDYQAFAQLGPIQTIVNQDAEAMGLEVELNAQPTDRLYLQLGASFMDSEVKDIALPSGNIADHDMPQAPPFAANALARYEMPIGNGIASIQGDVYYTDDFCFSALCAPVEQEDSYTVANARIAYGAGDGRWEVAAFVNNLFEEEYRVYAFDSSLFAGVVAGVYAKPRTYGVTASFRFGAGYELTRGRLKLPKPFFRLPIRFDAERLRAELGALPASAWSRHPQEYEGNTAARLISVGGTQTDFFVGAMAPTPALLASPYLQQVLASFSTVWSRSRLMRIAGGGKVPLHSDAIHHWFFRVRVHIPVITQPAVRFFCGDQSVHMAAGEAWAFDNWRQHRVENPSAEARVHLVADTAGTSEFWRLVMQGQSENFDRPNQRARLIGFDPAARPRLMIEQFNDWPLMPASEVEQLALDLLADLAPVDARPESVAAVAAFTNTVIAFCHDWRSLWYLHGDAPGARGRFEDLAGSTRRKLRQLRPVSVASTDTIAQNVIEARIFSMLFGGAGGSRPEAIEFGATFTPPPDKSGPSAGDEPTLSNLPTVELPQIELPTVEVPRIQAVASAPEPEPVVPRRATRAAQATRARAADHHPERAARRQHAAVRDACPGGGRVHDRRREPPAHREHRGAAAGPRRRELESPDAPRRHDGHRRGDAPAFRGANPGPRRPAAAVGRIRAPAGEDAEERAARAVPARGFSRRAVRVPAA